MASILVAQLMSMNALIRSRYVRLTLVFSALISLEVSVVALAHQVTRVMDITALISMNVKSTTADVVSALVFSAQILL